MNIKKWKTVNGKYEAIIDDDGNVQKVIVEHPNAHHVPGITSDRVRNLAVTLEITPMSESESKRLATFLTMWLKDG
jgi:hypothetical protein